jgi:hypothetical protein
MFEKTISLAIFAMKAQRHNETPLALICCFAQSYNRCPAYA